MANAHLKLVAPNTALGTVVTPRRKPNAELRPREYLTEDEIERLRKAAGMRPWFWSPSGTACGRPNL